jgi:hypothetical protein
MDAGEANAPTTPRRVDGRLVVDIEETSVGTV